MKNSTAISLCGWVFVFCGFFIAESPERPITFLAGIVCFIGSQILHHLERIEEKLNGPSA